MIGKRGGGLAWEDGRAEEGDGGAVFVLSCKRPGFFVFRGADG